MRVVVALAALAVAGAASTDRTADGPDQPLATVATLANGDAGRVSAPNKSGVAQPGDSARERVVRQASALVGTREEGGNNRGTVIEDIIANAGFPHDSAIPYCAAFVRYVFDRAGLAAVGPQGRASAWSPAWVTRPTWTRSNGGDAPQPGDVFGVWFPRLGRVGHVGLVEHWGRDVVTTIEGNTGPDVAGAINRDGDGIWRKRRQIRQVHSVRRWLQKGH